MKMLKKTLVLFLAFCFIFAAAGGAALTALAEEYEDFDEFDEFDIDEFDEWEFAENIDWSFDEGEEEYSAETLEDGSIVETYTTTYESGDVLVESVTSSSDGSILKEGLRYDGADGYVYSSEWEYTYDENGILVSGTCVETEFYPDNEESNVTQVTVNTYDEMGNILTANSEYTYEGGTVYTEEWVYVYNEDGVCVSGSCHAAEVVEDELNMEMEAMETYDENGNLLSQASTYAYADGTESSEAWTYAYNEDGVCVSGECEGSETYPDEGTVSRTVSETYNEDGNILTQYIEYIYPENDA